MHVLQEARAACMCAGLAGFEFVHAGARAMGWCHARGVCAIHGAFVPYMGRLCHTWDVCAMHGTFVSRQEAVDAQMGGGRPGCG
eukprot:335810-Chlamydomonas_euryale.AAC.1